MSYKIETQPAGLADASKTIMAPSFVRGNVVYVHSTPPTWAGKAAPEAGDRLTVGGRKKGGWLRVKNHRTGLVTSLKVGHWISTSATPTISKAPVKPTAIQQAQANTVALAAVSTDMDTLIRINRIKNLEDSVQKMNEDFFQEKTRLEACVDKLTDSNEIKSRRIESMEVTVAKLQAQLEEKQIEAAASALQLIEAKSQQMNLYNMMKASEEEATTAAEAYHRQVAELTTENHNLRARNGDLMEQLERTTEQLQDVTTCCQHDHEEVDSLDEEEAVTVYHPLDPRLEQ